MGHCSPWAPRSASARAPRPASTTVVDDAPSPTPLVRDASLRVGDVERDAVVAALTEHRAAGRLTATEHEQRVGQALAAVRGADLAPLLADLPPLPTRSTVRSSPAAPSGWTPAQRSAVRAHLAPWALVCAGLWLLWLVTAPGSHPWPVWPTLGWGVPVLVAVPEVLRAAGPRSAAAPADGATGGTMRAA